MPAAEPFLYGKIRILSRRPSWLGGVSRSYGDYGITPRIPTSPWLVQNVWESVDHDHIISSRLIILIVAVEKVVLSS